MDISGPSRKGGSGKVSFWKIALFVGQHHPSPLSNLSRTHQCQQSGNGDAHRNDEKPVAFVARFPSEKS
jgi:hypothetical protein